VSKDKEEGTMEDKVQKFVEPLNVALKMEEDGYDFYMGEVSTRDRLRGQALL